MNTLLILDLAVKSLAVLLAAFAAQTLWRRASAAQRCLVWLAAFTGLLALPLTLLVEPQWALAPEANSAPALIAPQAAGPMAPTVTENAAASPKLQPAPRSWLARLTPLQIAGAVWLVGILLVLSHRLLGAWRLRQLRLQSHPCQHEGILRQTQGLAESLGIRRPVQVRTSAALAVPVTWGIFKPVLLLPANAHEWDDESLSAALLHELGHIRQFDAATRLLATITCALHWPNPAAWMAARAWRAAQEQAADDLVLRAGSSPQNYALQLLQAARSFQTTGLTSAPVLAMARPTTLETRLSAIMDQSRNRCAAHGRSATAVATATLLALASLASVGLQGQTNQKIGASAAGKTQLTVEQKADAIILPRVTFAAATLEEALEFLKAKSRQLDPDHQGVNIIARAQEPSVKLDLDLHDVSLNRVLRLIAQLAQLEVRYESYAALLVPREKPIAAPSFPASPAVAKARAIIIPTVQFRDATLAEAIEFIRIKGRELSPDKKGVNIVLKTSASGSTAKITLDLISASLYDALKYTAELGGYVVEPQGDLFILVPGH